MKHLAAYLLLQLGGNATPSAADVTALLETVGIEPVSEQLDKLIAELEGKDINEVSAYLCGWKGSRRIEEETMIC
jgi:large subunit ribosomal protein LP2